MWVLFLDDDKKRGSTFQRRMIGHNITFVETPEVAIEALKGKRFDIASLDHDLFGKVFQPSDEKSGFAVVEFIDKMDVEARPGKVICHSYNPAGVDAMMALLVTSGVAALFDSEEYWNHLPSNEVIF